MTTSIKARWLLAGLLGLALWVVVVAGSVAADVIPPACTGEKAKRAFDTYLNDMYENKALALGPRCAFGFWGMTNSEFTGGGLIKEFEKKALEGCEKHSRGRRCRIYMRNNEVVSSPTFASRAEPTPASGASWQEYTDAGKKALRRAQFPEAERQFDAALNEAER